MKQTTIKEENLNQIENSYDNMISVECFESPESRLPATTATNTEPCRLVKKEVHLRLLHLFPDYTTILPYLDIDE